ncbi:MAG: PHP domain-containing protein, partial [Muribaculaceae bacterium]|nr:PHP domain-containing protein [Muribaculaceae bacterium]
MMDIINEIGQSQAYTLHSHTQFCDGKATMEEFAREAVRMGFTHYGFSPHSPIPIQSPCNMSIDDVPQYLAEFQRIKRVYGDRVNFYAGMEVDYLGPQWGPAHPYFSSLPLDYTIGSVHFIPDSDGQYIDIDGRYENFRSKMQQYFHSDIRYVVETFYRQSIDMVEAGGFDIIGHLDKVGHNASQWAPGIEDETWYIQLVNTLIDAIA